MTVAIDPLAVAPELMQAWMRASRAMIESFEPGLAELVEIRASQINGCANCINMHASLARQRGETEQRINLLPAWREAPCYTDREQAALAWAEALTRLPEEHDLKTARENLQAHFSPAEQVQLTMVVISINGWNRLAVGFGLWVEPADAAMALNAA